MEEKSKLVSLALGTAVSTLVLWKWCQAKRDAFRAVPGVWFLGVLPQFGSGGEDMAKKLDEFSERYGQEGVFEMDLAGSRVVALCSWPLISKVLEMRPFKAVKPSSMIHAAQGMIEGVFFSEGDRWKRERRLVSPAFNAKSLQSYVPAVLATTRSLISVLRKDCAKAKGEVNVTELLPLYTADVLCATAFGKDLGMLESRRLDLVQDVKGVLNSLGVRSMMPFPYWKIPLLGGFLDGGNAAADRLGLRMTALMKEQAGQGATVVEKLRQMEGEKLSHKEVVGNLKVLFAAGTDTTSVVLSWIFYHLARDAQLQEQVFQEVKDVAEASPSDLDAMPLVTALWLETLRLNGPAPFDFFETTEAVELAGRKVPAHTEIWVNYRYVLTASPEVKAKLGEDLEIFRPSRWIREEKLVKCPPFESLPFGHGARQCLGKQLADYEGRLVIAELLRHFKVEPWTGAELAERTTFVVVPKDDVVVSLTPR